MATGPSGPTTRHKRSNSLSSSIRSAFKDRLGDVTALKANRWESKVIGGGGQERNRGVSSAKFDAGEKEEWMRNGPGGGAGGASRSLGGGRGEGYYGGGFQQGVGGFTDKRPDPYANETVGGLARPRVGEGNGFVDRVGGFVRPEPPPARNDDPPTRASSVEEPEGSGSGAHTSGRSRRRSRRCSLGKWADGKVAFVVESGMLELSAYPWRRRTAEDGVDHDHAHMIDRWIEDKLGLAGGDGLRALKDLGERYKPQAHRRMPDEAEWWSKVGGGMGRRTHEDTPSLSGVPLTGAAGAMGQYDGALLDEMELAAREQEMDLARQRRLERDDLAQDDRLAALRRDEEEALALLVRAQAAVDEAKMGDDMALQEERMREAERAVEEARRRAEQQAQTMLLEEERLRGDIESEEARRRAVAALERVREEEALFELEMARAAFENAQMNEDRSREEERLRRAEIAFRDARRQAELEAAIRLKGELGTTLSPRELARRREMAGARRLEELGGIGRMEAMRRAEDLALANLARAQLDLDNAQRGDDISIFAAILREAEMGLQDARRGAMEEAIRLEEDLLSNLSPREQARRRNLARDRGLHDLPGTGRIHALRRAEELALANLGKARAEMESAKRGDDVSRLKGLLREAVASLEDARRQMDLETEIRRSEGMRAGASKGDGYGDSDVRSGRNGPGSPYTTPARMQSPRMVGPRYPAPPQIIITSPTTINSAPRSFSPRTSLGSPIEPPRKESSRPGSPKLTEEDIAAYQRQKKVEERERRMAEDEAGREREREDRESRRKGENRRDEKAKEARFNLLGGTPERLKTAAALADKPLSQVSPRVAELRKEIPDMGRGGSPRVSQQSPVDMSGTLSGGKGTPGASYSKAPKSPPQTQAPLIREVAANRSWNAFAGASNSSPTSRKKPVASTADGDGSWNAFAGAAKGISGVPSGKNTQGEEPGTKSSSGLGMFGGTSRNTPKEAPISSQTVGSNREKDAQKEKDKEKERRRSSEDARNSPSNSSSWNPFSSTEKAKSKGVSESSMVDKSGRYAVGMSPLSRPINSPKDTTIKSPPQTNSRAWPASSAAGSANQAKGSLRSPPLDDKNENQEQPPSDDSAGTTAKKGKGKKKK